MLKVLIKNELLKNIKDSRFMISSVIALGLIVLTTFILSEQYVNRVEHYQEARADQQRALGEVKVFSEIELNAHRPPNPLVIFNSGVSRNLETSVRITHASVPRQGLEKQAENPFMNVFQTADLAAIFQIVFSLLAILLVYDSISGEREEGTLVAALSNPVPRDQLLAGKCIAGFLGILSALLIGLLTSLLVMRLFYGIGFSGAQWLRIALIVFSTLCFLGFFLAAGILVSAKVKTASISLMWLLFIWVFTAVVQPNLSTYLASSVSSVPSRENVEAAIERVWDEYREKHRQIEAEIAEEVPGGSWMSDQGGRWPYYFCFDGNRTALLRYVYRTQRLQPLYARYAEKEFQIYQQEYERYLNRQLKYQNLLNYLSPAGLYSRITAALAGSDINHYEMFLDQARKFRGTYVSWLTNDKKIFSDQAFLYFSRQDMEQIRNNDYEERMAKRNRGETVVSYGRSEFEPLALNDLPRFTYNTAGIGRSLNYVIVDVALLIILAVVLFYFCTAAFSRYDVRQNS